MRILVVSTYFAPEVSGNAPFVAGVVEHYASLGHDVTVVTGFPHYPDWRPLERRRLFASRQLHGARVVRRCHLIPRKPSLISRFVYEASLLATGLPILLSRRRPDVVVGFSPALSDALAASLAAKWFRRPCALVFQDLFAMAAAEVGPGVSPRFVRSLRRFEYRLARSAAAVGYVADGFAQHLPAGESVMRLHNWSKFAQPTRSPAEVRRNRGWSGTRVVVHAGNMGDKQGLEVVIEAAALRRDVRFVFVGDGHQRRDLEERSRAIGLENVQFVGLVSDEEHAAVLAAADALLLVQKPAVRQMSLPSKLQSYLAARRPILACVSPESEAGLFLREVPHARLVAPGDARALADAVENLPRVESGRASGAVERAAALIGYERLLDAAVAANSLPSGVGAIA